MMYQRPTLNAGRKVGDMTQDEREKVWKHKDKIQIGTSILTFVMALSATLSGAWYFTTQLVMIPKDVLNLKVRVSEISMRQEEMHDEQIVLKTEMKNINDKTDHVVSVVDRIAAKL